MHQGHGLVNSVQEQQSGVYILLLSGRSISQHLGVNRLGFMSCCHQALAPVTLCM